MRRMRTVALAPSSTVEAVTGATRLTLRTALVMAVWLGLLAGYVDLAAIVAKKHFIHDDAWFRAARDFPWTVPIAHVALSMTAALALGSAAKLLPRFVSLRFGAFALTTLALWGALLRLPIWWWCGLILAAGVGWQFSRVVARIGFTARSPAVRWTVATLIGGVAVLFAAGTCQQSLRESHAIAALPPAVPGARNVLLLVLDTVRASGMSMYGYARATTPNLDRWAKRGIRFNRALAPAPWTVPSHAAMFTGRWPFATDTQWTKSLDTQGSTLAEFLASEGYQTAGFVANTHNCGYETGLNRGFIHYEDYALTPRTLLSRTVPGKWLLEHTWGLADAYERKWIGLQSRPADVLNAEFLDWLEQRRTDRPFFAFMNFFDVHEPYIPAPAQTRRFGITPTSQRDVQFLFDYLEMDKRKLTPRDLALARDSYDDCLAYLDSQIGALLTELDGRKILNDTIVVITSDHGEAFGEHGSYCHANSVDLEEVGVPLLILAPDASVAGRTVFREVTLRDLPATVADLVGLSNRSPFPGHSLAGFWRVMPGEVPDRSTSPALSEQVYSNAFVPGPDRAQNQALAQMSLVAFGGFQYIRNAQGQERLYRAFQSAQTQHNLAGSPEAEALMEQFRQMLLEILDSNPGAPAAEDAYLKSFRRGLCDQLDRRPLAGERPGCRKHGHLP